MAIDVTVDGLNTEIEVTIAESQGYSSEVGEVVILGDHSNLANRDASDQHPISAITGLAEALTALPTVSERAAWNESLHGAVNGGGTLVFWKAADVI